MMQQTNQGARVVLLSYPYDPADPLPPAIPPGRVEPFMSLERDMDGLIKMFHG